jgi:hypothetical protein
MSWAQRLKRVFNIDIEVCGRCGGSVKVIACIEDQDIIDRILAHLRDKELATPSLPLLTPLSRAPPECALETDEDCCPLAALLSTIATHKAEDVNAALSNFITA